MCRRTGRVIKMQMDLITMYHIINDISLIKEKYCSKNPLEFWCAAFGILKHLEKDMVGKSKVMPAASFLDDVLTKGDPENKDVQTLQSMYIEYCINFNEDK